MRRFSERYRETLRVRIVPPIAVVSEFHEMTITNVEIRKQRRTHPLLRNRFVRSAAPAFGILLNYEGEREGRAELHKKKLNIGQDKVSVKYIGTDTCTSYRVRNKTG